MTEKDLIPGTVVQHFKRKMLTEAERADSTQYLYEILGVAHHTETGEKLVVYRLNAFIAIINVQVRAAPVYIFRFELTTVVVDGAFPDGNADRSLHKISLPFTFRPQPGFCYSCQE